MPRVILVRHGQTIWNKARFVGRADIPLDATGAAHAEALPGLLAGESVDAVLTSPMLRARRTAAPLLAELGLAPIVDDDLMELDCGTLTGEDRVGAQKLSKRDPDEPFPMGESLADAYVRAARVARRLTDFGDRTVVVVGHYIVNQMVAGVLLGRDVGAALALEQTRLRPGQAIVVTPESGEVTRLTAGTRV